jgi:hypothetical protein
MTLDPGACYTSGLKKVYNNWSLKFDQLRPELFEVVAVVTDGVDDGSTDACHLLKHPVQQFGLTIVELGQAL